MKRVRLMGLAGAALLLTGCGHSAAPSDAAGLRATFDAMAKAAGGSQFGRMEVGLGATHAHVWDGSAWHRVGSTPGGRPSDYSPDPTLGWDSSPIAPEQVPWDRFSGHLGDARATCQDGKTYGVLNHTAGGAWLEKLGCDDGATPTINKIYVDGSPMATDLPWPSREHLEAQIDLARKILPPDAGISAFALNNESGKGVAVRSGSVGGKGSVGYSTSPEGGPNFPMRGPECASAQPAIADWSQLSTAQLVASAELAVKDAGGWRGLKSLMIANVDGKPAWVARTSQGTGTAPLG